MNVIQNFTFLIATSCIFILSTNKVNFIKYDNHIINTKKTTLSLYKNLKLSTLTEKEAIERVKFVTNSNNEFSVICKEKFQNTTYFLIREYELNTGATVTLKWYYVDVKNGMVYEWDIITNNLKLLL